MQSVTRDHFCFVIFPDDEDAVDVRHRSCPQTPKCRPCLVDFEKSVKENACTNVGQSGRWKKCLLLEYGQTDPRPSSDEFKSQRSKFGLVSSFYFYFESFTFLGRQ